MNKRKENFILWFGFNAMYFIEVIKWFFEKSEWSPEICCSWIRVTLSSYLPIKLVTSVVIPLTDHGPQPNDFKFLSSVLMITFIPNLIWFTHANMPGYPNVVHYSTCYDDYFSNTMHQYCNRKFDTENLQYCKIFELFCTTKLP